MKNKAFLKIITIFVMIAFTLEATPLQVLAAYWGVKENPAPEYWEIYKPALEEHTVNSNPPGEEPRTEITFQETREGPFQREVCKVSCPSKYLGQWSKRDPYDKLFRSVGKGGCGADINICQAYSSNQCVVDWCKTHPDRSATTTETYYNYSLWRVTTVYPAHYYKAKVIQLPTAATSTCEPLQNDLLNLYKTFDGIPDEQKEQFVNTQINPKKQEIINAGCGVKSELTATTYDPKIETRDYVNKISRVRRWDCGKKDVCLPSNQEIILYDGATTTLDKYIQLRGLSVEMDIPKIRSNSYYKFSLTPGTPEVVEPPHSSTSIIDAANGDEVVKFADQFRQWTSGDKSPTAHAVYNNVSLLSTGCITSFYKAEKEEGKGKVAKVFTSIFAVLVGAFLSGGLGLGWITWGTPVIEGGIIVQSGFSIFHLLYLVPFLPLDQRTIDYKGGKFTIVWCPLLPEASTSTISVTNPTCNSLTLSVDLGSATSTSFDIQRDGVTIPDAHNKTTYVDTGLSPHKTYKYRAVVKITTPGGDTITTTSNEVTGYTTCLPNCSLSANPKSITKGGQAKLEWACTNADSAQIIPSIKDGLIGDLYNIPSGKVGAGDVRVQPEKTTTYTLTGVNVDGSSISATKVEVYSGGIHEINP